MSDEVNDIMDASDARIDAMLEDAEGIHKVVDAIERDKHQAIVDEIGFDPSRGYEAEAYEEPEPEPPRGRPARPQPRQPQPQRAQGPSAIAAIIPAARVTILLQVLSGDDVVFNKLMKPSTRPRKVTFRGIAPGRYTVVACRLLRGLRVTVVSGRAARADLR